MEGFLQRTVVVALELPWMFPCDIANHPNLLLRHVLQQYSAKCGSLILVSLHLRATTSTRKEFLLPKGSFSESRNGLWFLPFLLKTLLQSDKKRGFLQKITEARTLNLPCLALEFNIDTRVWRRQRIEYFETIYIIDGGNALLWDIGDDWPVDMTRHRNGLNFSTCDSIRFRTANIYASCFL